MRLVCRVLRRKHEKYKHFRFYITVFVYGNGGQGVHPARGMCFMFFNTNIIPFPARRCQHQN